MSLVPPKAGCPVLLDAAGALQTRLRLKQCKSPFRQPLRCSAACQWEFSLSPICPAAPRRRGRKRRGNCLRAKPEFFRVPPSARSKGSPQGQDWSGCLFLVSSFGHAKEERKTAPDDARAGSILGGFMIAMLEATGQRSARRPVERVGHGEAARQDRVRPGR